MISSLILFAMLACGHAQKETVVYAGNNAKSMLDGREPDHTFIIPPGECVAYYPLEKIRCFRLSYHGPGYYVGLTDIKIDVEEETDEIYIEVNEPIMEFYVVRFTAVCESNATVTVTKKCMLG